MIFVKVRKIVLLGITLWSVLVASQIEIQR